MCLLDRLEPPVTFAAYHLSVLAPETYMNTLLVLHKQTCDPFVVF